MNSLDNDWRVFARRGGSVLGASIVAAIAVALLAWPGNTAWAVFGCLATGLVGLVGAVKMVRIHGEPGNRFLVTMIVTMGARFAAAASGALAAATLGGPGAVLTYVLGLACGFVPLAIYEMVWFFKSPGATATRLVAEEKPSA